MKLRHLEIFYAVMTCGSLSRAAESLNISQPAASKALKSAELKLGFTLFQRVRGKLLPTSEAITLFEKAQTIYQDLDNLRLLADNLARDPRAKITLGCLPSLGLSLVPELVTDFYQQNSNLLMTLTTEHTETLVRKLDLREIDLALTLQPVQQGEILTTLIAEVPLVYIDRHYRQGAVDISEIDQQRWISPGPHSLSAASPVKIGKPILFPPRLHNLPAEQRQTQYMVAVYFIGLAITGAQELQQPAPLLKRDIETHIERRIGFTHPFHPLQGNAAVGKGSDVAVT